jgi:phosphoribosylformylglycinamidine cyclo-ligase
MAITYKDSGVDIKAGDDFVDAIKEMVVKKSTKSNKGTAIGMFGAAFDVSELGMKHPILVTGTDGVGTKLKIANKTNNHSSIGVDLVAMCVNDILCHGALPKMFLDYYASGKLDPAISKQIIEGIIEGCNQAECELSGGETAEMPGLYHGKDYDLAGFAIGFCEKEDFLPKNTVAAGDLIIGIGSSGVHSNGYSLVNKVLEVNSIDINKIDPRLSSGKTVGEVLITPTKIYVKQVKGVLTRPSLKALAHITGGGIYDNIIRVIPSELDINIDFASIKRPEIFNYIQSLGEVDEAEMRKVFNLGLGFVVVCSKDDAEFYLGKIEGSFICGEVIARA